MENHLKNYYDWSPPKWAHHQSAGALVDLHKPTRTYHGWRGLLGFIIQYKLSIVIEHLYPHVPWNIAWQHVRAVTTVFDGWSSFHAARDSLDNLHIRST